MSSLKTYGGSPLFSMVAAKAYAKDRNKYRGTGTSNGQGYAYDVLQAPTVQLVHGNSAYTIVFSLAQVRVQLSMPAPLPAFDQNVPMQVTGRLAVSGGSVRLTGLAASAVNTNGFHQAVVDLVNAAVLPGIQQRVQALPIPQLNKLFDGKLAVVVKKGAVIGGPVMELLAGVSGRSSFAAADKPGTAELALLSTGSASSARVVGVVSADAINHVIKLAKPKLKLAFNKSKSKFGFGAGIKGTIQASTPELSIANSKGSVRTIITFSGLKGGLRVPLKGWTWIPLPSPATKVVIGNSLSTTGGKGKVKLTGVSSLKVNINWPGFLKPVEAMIEGLLNGVLRLFKGNISSAVKGMDIPAFKLSSVIPGTTLPAKLSFDGLAYYKRSLKAKVRVKA